MKRKRHCVKFGYKRKHKKHHKATPSYGMGMERERASFARAFHRAEASLVREAHKGERGLAREYHTGLRKSKYKLSRAL